MANRRPLRGAFLIPPPQGAVADYGDAYASTPPGNKKGMSAASTLNGAHDFLTANDGPNFLRAALALSVHFPPIRRVADVSERIEDLSDVPDATREERRAIRDAARQKNEETPVTPWRDNSPECCGVAVVLRCGTRSPDSGICLFVFRARGIADRLHAGDIGIRDIRQILNSLRDILGPRQPCGERLVYRSSTAQR